MIFSVYSHFIFEGILSLIVLDNSIRIQNSGKPGKANKS